VDRIVGANCIGDVVDALGGMLHLVGKSKSIGRGAFKPCVNGVGNDGFSCWTSESNVDLIGTISKLFDAGAEHAALITASCV
jgi:hypothetical protein